MKLKRIGPILLIFAALLLVGCALKEQDTGLADSGNSYYQISQDEAIQMMGVDDGHIIVDVRRLGLV